MLSRARTNIRLGGAPPKHAKGGSRRPGAIANPGRRSRVVELTTKTIQGDLDFMREHLRLPIAYDQDAGGYRFTQPISSFPMVELTEAELVSVFIGQKALAQHKGTPFEAPLRSALEKLTSNLIGIDPPTLLPARGRAVGAVMGRTSQDSRPG